ncbi:unnamed protein product [Clonostachys byssicola]|uniref:mitogen-activated protein kinase n=1 Tax=Clonostachys byssicola TaxID=160290 RepID=A0A9N9XYA5_9HYPO|nr:unnamed protein product [Clonostachys byssicola]
MSGKRDSFLSLPTKKWKKILGLGLEDDEIQAKVLEATSGNQVNNDLSSFSQVVQLTGSGILDEYARNLRDYHHKRVLQVQLWDIRTLVEDNRQLDKEREDSSYNGWLDKVIRPPPPRLGSGYILPNSSLGLPNLTPIPASSARVSPSGSFSGSTAPLSPELPSKSTSAIWDGRWQNQGGMDNAVGFPAADNGGRSTPRDFTTDRSREMHHKMVAKLTLQAIHMLLACESIIEFLQTNGDKLLFSTERDAGLWNIYMTEISKHGTYNMRRCRKELAKYFQDIEGDPSEELHGLGGSILEKAMKEMRGLSRFFANLANFGGACVFADDALGLTSSRLFSESANERFDYVDEWEVQINEIEARNRDNIMGDMNEVEKRDLQFRRTHLDLAVAMRKIAAQFADFARKPGSGPSENFKMLYVSKPSGPGTVAPTQTLLEVPREEPNLTFLTAPQELRYKTRFDFLADEGSHVVSREKTTKSIQRLKIHPRSVAHIWQAVEDVTSSNELYFPEYALAMYLGNELREGRSIPLKVPPTIKKNVEDRVNFIVANIVQKEEDQPDPTQHWICKDVELGRRINEVGDQVRRALIEMTEEEEHACISDEETSGSHTLGLSWTPGRGSSIGETHRTNEQETEITELMELQTTIKGTQGEDLEVEGEMKHVDPSLAKNTWSDIPVRDGNLESEAALNDRDGALLRAHEVKRPRVAEQEPQEADAAKAKVKLPRDMEEDEEQVDKAVAEARRWTEAAAEARRWTEAAAEERRQVEEAAEEQRRILEEAAEERRRDLEEEERRVLEAAAEAEAEEQRQPVEAQHKRETQIQRQQEVSSGDQEGCDEPTGELSLDRVENLVMPREETERNITASTPGEDHSELVDIAPQSEQLQNPDSNEEDSRRQTLTKGRETPTPSTGEGTATGTQMPQHRQMELLGHPDDRHQTPSPKLRIQRQQTPNSDLSSISSSRTIPDLVRDSKLETAFAPNGQVVRHISYATNPRMRRRRIRKEEIWERQSELGSGAFGRVWLGKCATGDDIGKLRAVKEITKLQRQRRSSEIDYNRELEAIAKFSHKKYVHCFVQSFGWYESEEAIFIAMEYLEHGDLQSHLVRPFPEDEVRDIVFQLLEGLSFMHENGFAHRDLKPANILVSEHSPNWWVKISDFGISKRAEEEATAFRTLVGTRGYIAPEVIGIYCPEDIATIADSSSLYTVAVDLWALGAIMFKLLTHENVFAEPLELARYVTARRPFPRALVSEKGVSEACMSFLEQAMAHSPTSRPTSSQALAHEWLAELSNPADSPVEFPDTMSASTGLSPGPFTPVPGESTASAAWPSTFS